MQWAVVVRPPPSSPHSLTGPRFGEALQCDGGGLTTVVLVGTIPAVIHAITVKGSGQTLGEIPTGKMPFGAQRSHRIAAGQCEICMKDGRADSAVLR